MGVKSYNKKDYRTACSTFELLLKKSPEDVNALYYDALCWYQLRDSDTATRRYKRIIELAPQSAAAEYAQTALNAMPGSTASRSAVSTRASTSTEGSRTAAFSTASVKSSMDIGSRASASTSGSRSEPADMKSLPDTASFYFTKEPNGHMLVNLMVNGHPVPAWFDTGADAFFYRDQLEANGVDCNKAQPAGSAQGWAGKSVPIFAMPAEVRLGNLTRKIQITMEASSTSLGKNLIGQSIIDGYQYEIDDKGGRVDLRKSIASSQQQISSMYDIPCTIENSRDILKVEINGRPVVAFIDTGSAFTIVDANTADSLGIETSGVQHMTGVGGDLTVRVGTARIRLGPINKEFTVRVGGAGGTCIGQDFMEGWRFKIDRERKLLRFFH